MNLTFHNFYEKKNIHIKKICRKVVLKYLHKLPYMKNHINPTEIACAIPSLEKLLYIKESQRLCQSVVNLAMHLSDDQCMKTSLR